MTRVRVSRNDLSRERADLAVCFAYENDTQPRGVGDAGLRRELARQMKAEKFEGTPRDALVWSANGNYPARRFLILGLGRRSAAAGETVTAVVPARPAWPPTIPPPVWPWPCPTVRDRLPKSYGRRWRARCSAPIDSTAT